MAMAIPVFVEEKWHSLDSNLTMHYRMFRALPYLGTSKRSLSLQAFKVATRELRLLNFLWRYLEHKMTVQIGERLTCTSCVAVISGSLGFL